MNSKVIKISNYFIDSQCGVCGQIGLGQFHNVKENYVNFRGNLVSYTSILESTLNYQIPAEENLEICEACKSTIISFYLLKTKFDEGYQLSSTFNYSQHHNPDENNQEQYNTTVIKQEKDCIETENYTETDQTAPVPKRIKKRRPERIQWKERQEFATSDEAVEFVKTQKIWSVKHTKPVSKSGEKRQYFRCNLIPKANPRQCSSVMALVTKSDGSTVMLQSVQPHDHSQIINNIKTE